MPIEGLEEFVQELAVDILTDASEAFLEELRERSPYATGELRDSAYGPDVDERELTAIIGFEAPQADYTDLGTPPHPIFPSNASALRFFWEDGPDGPGMYTFDSVNHPGQAATGWFTDSLEEWDDFVQSAADAQR